MTAHLLAFADALGLANVDVLGFSLGGMVAQQAALERPSLIRKMLLVGTAPEGGEDIMHIEKPELRRILEDRTLAGYQVLVKLFFTPSEASQTAARRLRRGSRHGPKIGSPSRARRSRRPRWRRFGRGSVSMGSVREAPADTLPCLVVNGVFDNMIPVRNSYFLAEHLPDATLLVYPDAGHGSLFQFHDSFVQQTTLFLDS